MCLYNNILKLCLQKGITVSRLLSELDMSASNKQKWERGSNITSAALLKLADYFDCSADYLLGRTEDPVFKKSNDYSDRMQMKQELQAVIQQLERMKDNIH